MHPRVRVLIPFVAVPMVAGADVASANLMQLSASKDNTLYEQASGTLSNGAGSFFFAGKTGTNEIRRGLVAFNLQPTIPAGSVVTAATLTLHVSQTQPGAQTVALHRVTADWGEGASDATGGEGGGAASTAGDATRIHRFFNNTLWATTGGDYAGAASASALVGDSTFYSWSGAGVVADVQQWVDQPATNFGWALVGNEGAIGTAKRFDSRQNAVTVVRPVLIVDFIPVVPAYSPVPLATLGLALLFCGMALLRSRARAHVALRRRPPAS